MGGHGAQAAASRIGRRRRRCDGAKGGGGSPTEREAAIEPRRSRRRRTAEVPRDAAGVERPSFFTRDCLKVDYVSFQDRLALKRQLHDQRLAGSRAPHQLAARFSERQPAKLSRALHHHARVLLLCIFFPALFFHFSHFPSSKLLQAATTEPEAPGGRVPSFKSLAHPGSFLPPPRARASYCRRSTTSPAPARQCFRPACFGVQRTR